MAAEDKEPETGVASTAKLVDFEVQPLRRTDNKDSNRWWEFYFVRYFVGTGVGVFIVLALSHGLAPGNATNGTMPELLRELFKNVTAWNALLVGGLGLAYCYISSAPVLVFHAARGALLNHQESSQGKGNDVRMVVWAPTVVAVTLILAVTFLCDQNAIGKACLIVLAYVFSIQVGLLVLLALPAGRQRYLEYTREVARRRAFATPAGKQYIESYKHLREHGNSLLIVMLEVVLAVILYAAPIAWPLIVLIWVTPASLVWVFAGTLEAAMLGE